MDRLINLRKAKQLNDQHYFDLLKYQGWHRGSLKSISLVSLHPDRPQLKIKNIEALKAHAALIGPKRPTSERQLQSWIIYNALLNDGHLPFDLCIKFVTDEFARPGDTRKTGDIFGFNPSTNTFVLIELKWKRLLKELTGQLNDAEQAVKNDLELYKELLNIYGYQWNEPYKIEKIAVWPSSNKPYKMCNSDVREIGYTHINDGYSFHELTNCKSFS